MVFIPERGNKVLPSQVEKSQRCVGNKLLTEAVHHHDPPPNTSSTVHVHLRLCCHSQTAHRPQSYNLKPTEAVRWAQTDRRLQPRSQVTTSSCCSAELSLILTASTRETDEAETGAVLGLAASFMPKNILYFLAPFHSHTHLNFSVSHPCIIVIAPSPAPAGWDRGERWEDRGLFILAAAQISSRSGRKCLTAAGAQRICHLRRCLPPAGHVIYVIWWSHRLSPKN